MKSNHGCFLDALVFCGGLLFHAFGLKRVKAKKETGFLQHRFLRVKTIHRSCLFWVGRRIEYQADEEDEKCGAGFF